MKPRFSLLSLLAISVMLAACDNGKKPAANATPTAEEHESPASATSAAAASTPESNAALLDPSQFTEKAPDTYRAKFDTTKGAFVIEVTRKWSPNGADRFYNLVKSGFYNDVAFFRVVPNFMVQFGMHGDPAVNKAWQEATIHDDQVLQSNQKGYVTFAKTSMPNSRTSQVFINFRDNSFLDNQGFSPFGKVVEGMDVVNSIYSGYGDAPPRGRGPQQGLIGSRGNEYLKSGFPDMDWVKTATIEE